MFHNKIPFISVYISIRRGVFFLRTSDLFPLCFCWWQQLLLYYKALSDFMCMLCHISFVALCFAFTTMPFFLSFMHIVLWSNNDSLYILVSWPVFLYCYRHHRDCWLHKLWWYEICCKSVLICFIVSSLIHLSICIKVFIQWPFLILIWMPENT